MSLWKTIRKVSLSDGDILMEKSTDSPPTYYRVTILPVGDVAHSEREARERVALRLDRLAAELRK